MRLPEGPPLSRSDPRSTLHTGQAARGQRPACRPDLHSIAAGDYLVRVNGAMLKSCCNVLFSRHPLVASDGLREAMGSPEVSSYFSTKMMVLARARAVC